MKLLKKLKWLWKCIWGRKYFIKYTDKLKDDEILIHGHTIYVPRNK